MQSKKAIDTKATPAIKQERKPWKKRTSVEIVLQLGEKLRVEITKMEKNLEAKRRELQKFEEAKKVLESN